MKHKHTNTKRNFTFFLQHMGKIFPIFLLLLFLLNLVTPTRHFSEKENRVLSSRPEFSISQILSGKWESKYETYVNDQFVFRDLWVTTKATCDRILGKVENNGVYLGNKGHLMEAFSAPSSNQLTTTIQAITTFAAKHPEIPQYTLIAPNAVNILSDLLPATVIPENQNIYLDLLQTSMQNAGITFIDTRETLSSHADENIYYKTDHHWTTQGAYYAYLEAAKALNLSTEGEYYEKAPVTYRFQGTLSAKSGFRSSQKEEMQVFLPAKAEAASIVNYVEERKKTASFYDTSKLEERDKYAMFFGGNHSQVKISTPAAQDRTLLILKDSYANCFVPFLTPHYRNIIMIDPRYFYGDLESIIAAENVQEILYLYNANTFFSDSSLEMTLTADIK